MERKIISFRITDEEKERLKAYLDKIRNNIELEPQKQQEPKETEPTRTADVQQFLDTAEKWYNAMKDLLAIGAINQIPAIFKTGGQQFISPTGIVSVMGNSATELPAFVEDVLNGGSYPNPEDCTEEERDVLYNPMFQEHYKRYISTKDDKSRGLLRGIIAEFIEHNFPMLKKDTK